MFDGSDARQGISHGTMIGKFWIDVITQGDGVFHNCNQRSSYFYNGVGMVHHNDAENELALIMQ